MSLPPAERRPARALANALKGRTVIDASCDAEGNDDLRLRLDDGTTILIDIELDVDGELGALALGRGPGRGWSCASAVTISGQDTRP